MSDVENFQRSIGNVANRNYTSADGVVAAKVGEALRALGGQPMADAHLAQGRLYDTQWLTKPGLTPTAAMARASKNVSQGAQTAMDPAGRQAMQDLADLQPTGWRKPVSSGLDIAQGVLANKTAASTAGAIAGGMGHGFLGGTAGAVAAPLVGALANKTIGLLRQRDAKRAMKAALAATSTGLPATADQFRNAPWLSQAARQALYANAAQGQ